MEYFYQLMEECDITILKKHLKKLFKYSDNDEEKYLNWYHDIKKIKPIISENTICCLKNKYYDTFMIEKNSIDNIDEITHYSILLTSYKDLLGMQTYFNDLSKEEFLARVLYEKTFFGFTDEESLSILDGINLEN